MRRSKSVLGGRSAFRGLAAAIMGLAVPANGLAADRSWNAGNGTWTTPGNWTPAGVPGVNDVVRIGNLPGVQDAVVNAAGANFVPDAIEISDGMTLDTGGVEFVGSPFLVTISGGDSRMIVRPQAGGNAYDFVGTLQVGPGAAFELVGNVPVMLGFGSDSYSWGRIEGIGEIVVNSPTPFNNNGVVNPGGANGLRITQDWFPLPPIDLDGSADFGQVWLTVPYSIFELNASGLADPFDGVISMAPGALVTMNLDDGWTVDSGGVIHVYGGIANAAAQINGDDLTLAGTVNVADEGILRVLADATVEDSTATYIFADSRMEFDGVTTVEGGWYRLYNGARIDFDGPTTVQGGEFITNSTDPADGVVNFNGSTTWNGSGPVEINGVARQMGNAFVNGPMVINGDVFDMDGDGDTAWTVWNDLVINAESLQPDGSDTFAGTITVANGTLGRLTVHVEPVDADFQMAGEMNLIGHPAVYGTRYAGDTLNLLGQINVSGKVAMSGYLRAFNGTIDIGDADATLRLDGGGLITGNCTFSGDGELRIGPSSSPLLVDTNLTGVGLVNEGVLRFQSAIDVDRFSNEAGGTWRVSLSGYDAGVTYDQLHVTGGDAGLAGEIAVELLAALPGDDPFAPVVGDEFTILTTAAGEILGDFNRNPTTFSEGRRYEWQVRYLRSSVRLRLAAIVDCALGDLDDDGDIDLQDLAILLANFGTVGAAEWAMGDLDDDDDVDLQDLALLLASFGSNCE